MMTAMMKTVTTVTEVVMVVAVMMMKTAGMMKMVMLSKATKVMMKKPMKFCRFWVHLYSLLHF